MSAASVTAIVLNWNGLADTARCCGSLAAQTHPLRVLVVDNGSTAHGIDELRAACPGAELVPLETNRGFAGGVNAGLRVACEGTARAPDFIWLLNNDTDCRPEALARLLAGFADRPRLGAMGCAMLEDAGAGRRRLVPAGKRLRPPLFIPLPPAGPVGIDYLTGACMLIRREALDAVGLPDDGFFFFFEDADWCFRARQAGWSFDAVPEALMEHTGSASIGTLGERKARYYRAGHVRFLRKHCRHPLAAALPAMAWRLLADGLRGRLPAVRGSLAGWKDGWASHLDP